MFSETQRFGLGIEEWVAVHLSLQGYDARLLPGFFAGVDIMVGPLAVEVKAARPRWQKAGGNGRVWRQRWQFDASRMVKHQDCVVVLVAIDDNGELFPFVCPSWLVAGRRNIHITSHPARYQGRLAVCLNNWSMVDTVLARRERQAGQCQLPLFSISQEMVTRE